MSVVQLNQIAKNIDDGVGLLVDVSDAGSPDDARRTRGLAAWLLCRLCGAPDQDAADAVVDGYGDNGIDAVWFDEDARVIYVVQTKWAKKGTGSPASGNVHKFVHGVRDMVNAEWGRFNTKMLGMPDFRRATAALSPARRPRATGRRPETSSREARRRIAHGSRAPLYWSGIGAGIEFGLLCCSLS